MTVSEVEINEVKLESKGDSGSQNLLFGAGIGTLFGKYFGNKYQNAKCTHTFHVSLCIVCGMCVSVWMCVCVCPYLCMCVSVYMAYGPMSGVCACVCGVCVVYVCISVC